jgi:unsaturated rhamnogalacturonyl hydrolase
MKPANAMKKYHLYSMLLVLVWSMNLKAQGDNIFQRKHINNTMLEVVEWQLNNPKHELTDWTNGAFYAGVFAAYETTKSPKILKALLDMGEKNGWAPGPRFDHADDIAISQTYIDLYRLKKEQRIIQPTIDSIQKLKNEKGPEAMKKGITWWWCDALFMGPPTLTKLGATLKDPAYFQLNDALFQQTYDLLYNKEERLFARDASYLWNDKGEGKKEANGKEIFWSRGNGWVAGGLVRLLKELPKDYPKRGVYLAIYKQMMERVVALQQTDGLWRASLLDPESFPGGEGSGSGFYCYALAWGINNKILDRNKYLPAVKRAWIGLNTLVSPDGRVGWVQPIGADPRKNFNAESWEVYGAGAFLLAGSEVIKIRF